MVALLFEFFHRTLLILKKTNLIHTSGIEIYVKSLKNEICKIFI